MKKDKLESKKKHPILRSLWQISLLIFILILFSSVAYYLDDIGNVAVAYSYVLLISGIIGFIVILLNNLAGKNCFKIYMNITLIAIVVTGVASGAYSLYEKNMKEKELCGDNGNLSYCVSGEPVSCGDGNIAILNGKSYKCLPEDEYLMSILGKYDYPCIEKFNKYPVYDEEYLSQIAEDNQNRSFHVYDGENNINADLIEAEKQCVPTKLDNLYSNMIKSRKEALPSKYDIRDKVKVTAGNQGRSDTCAIWSKTKALEISAQLKGINYQFLLDFERKINSLNIDKSESLDASINNSNLVPGNWSFIGGILDERNTGDITYLSLPEELDNYLEEYRYLYPNDTNKYYDKYFQDIEITRTKLLVMDYGNAFISSPKDKFDHEMVIIGWDDSKEAWLVLNSWGNTWSGYDGFVSNGDGTTWIKYSDSRFELLSPNVGYAIELISE